MPVNLFISNLLLERERERERERETHQSFARQFTKIKRDSIYFDICFSQKNIPLQCNNCHCNGMFRFNHKKIMPMK